MAAARRSIISCLKLGLKPKFVNGLRVTDKENHGDIVGDGALRQGHKEIVGAIKVLINGAPSVGIQRPKTRVY